MLLWHKLWGILELALTTRNCKNVHNVIQNMPILTLLICKLNSLLKNPLQCHLPNQWKFNNWHHWGLSELENIQAQLLKHQAAVLYGVDFV